MPVGNDRPNAEQQHKIKIEDLISNLARTIEFIQKIMIEAFDVLPEAVHRLLSNRKQIISMNSDLSYFAGEGELRSEEEEQLENYLLDVIAKHRKILEYLDLSQVTISFQNWTKHLTSADFPKTATAYHLLSQFYSFIHIIR